MALNPPLALGHRRPASSTFSAVATLTVSKGRLGSASWGDYEDECMANTRKVLETVASKPLVRSRQRVQEHAEVLTPAWLVDDMLDLVKHEFDRIDSRFLEPACGTGNFLVRVLARKLATVQSRYGRSEFEKRHQSLFALMCVYGIEIQADNAAECRENLLKVFSAFLRLREGDLLLAAARTVVRCNIVYGDALAMRAMNVDTGAPGLPIEFAQWGYLGRGRYQRRDFRLEVLASRASAHGADASEVFKPVRSYPQMTIKELAE